MRAFITGTDTGVGKTYVTALLTRALRTAGLDTVALKPLCCGSREDVEILCAAAGGELTSDQVNPIWLRTPVAPLVASREEGLSISLEVLAVWFREISVARKSVLVEGAGGWLVPVGDRTTVADLAEKLALPVIVVVANRLGCLNHTLLTLESIRARGLKCDGIILNSMSGAPDDATQTNREILVELAGVPLLFEIAHGQNSLDLAVG